jgi:hypothetical protein
MYDMCYEIFAISHFHWNCAMAAAAASSSTLVVALAAEAGAFLNLSVRRCFFVRLAIWDSKITDL